MRKILLAIIVLLSISPVVGLSQVVIYEGGSSNQFNPCYRYYAKKSSHKTTLFLPRIKWGYNALVSGINSMSMPNEINFLNQQTAIPQFSIVSRVNRFDIIRRFMYLNLELELEFNNFRFKHGKSLQQSADGGIEQLQGIDPDNVEKSKLSTNYINIPMTVSFHLGTVQLYGGVVGGWCYNAHTKVKHVADNDSHKFKDNNLPVERFRYGYTAGIFVPNWKLGFYGTYYPQSIFENTPNVNQLNFGVIITPFRFLR